MINLENAGTSRNIWRTIVNKILLTSTAIVPGLFAASIFPAHLTLLSMTESIQSNYENKSATLETIGAVLADSFIPDGINVLQLAFKGKASALGKTNRGWFKKTVAAMEVQSKLDFDEAKVQLAPVHLTVMEKIGEISPDDLTAKIRLRTLATIAENSIIPSEDIGDMITTLKAKAEDLDVSSKAWVKNPLLTLAAQSEIHDGLLDANNVAGIPLTAKAQDANAVAAE